MYHGDPRPTHWHSKNGRIIAIRELEDGHLVNIIASLTRQGVKHASEVVDAVFAAESKRPSSVPPPAQVRLVEVIRAVAMVPMYRALMAEADRRRLNLPV